MDYTDPKTKLGMIIASNPLDLLCVGFIKVGPSKDGKENILVLTDTFIKFSQAFVTSNQKAITVAKNTSGQMVLCLWYSYMNSQQ